MRGRGSPAESDFAPRAGPSRQMPCTTAQVVRDSSVLGTFRKGL